jgi:hypothetical protein
VRSGSICYSIVSVLTPMLYARFSMLGKQEILTTCTQVVQSWKTNTENRDDTRTTTIGKPLTHGSSGRFCALSGLLGVYQFC